VAFAYMRAFLVFWGVAVPIFGFVQYDKVQQGLAKEPFPLGVWVGFPAVCWLCFFLTYHWGRANPRRAVQLAFDFDVALDLVTEKYPDHNMVSLIEELKHERMERGR